MNKDYMARMSAAELDEYAKVLGVATSPAKTAIDKVKLIERCRGRKASIRVLSLDLEISIKRAHDKRVADLMAKPDLSDAETEEVMRMLLGDEQMGEVVRACTEDDGTIDIDAMGLVFAKVLTSKELKNF